ncbi:hypothetical protein PsyrCH409_12990 [Pseudomonas viridiflava]|nr:hypothetical protein PsyrCH409_12990 [Pseudomonas viridiflava]
MSVDNSIKEYKASFEEWVLSRDIKHWGTNTGASTIAFQRWRHFKEAFAPELIRRAVSESPIPVKSCLDPFGGSGTTALACQFLGIHPHTIEVNPYLADLIESKLSSYDPFEVSRDFGKTVKNSYEIAPNKKRLADQSPPTFYEPGEKGRWIFNDSTADRLSCILESIEKLPNKKHARLFRSLLGGVLVDASNVIVNGKGRRYRKNWNTRSIEANHIDNLFQSAVKNAIGDITRYGSRQHSEYCLLRGDSRLLASESGKIDLCVFSPPYPNSFDYTDVYNVELWVLGYLSSKESNRDLRNKTLSSHVQIFRNYEKVPLNSESLNEAIAMLIEKRHQLWNKNIPEMIGGYFADLIRVIDGVKKNLSTNGTMWMVVGDSRYVGVMIPTAKILSELLIIDGWRLIKNEPFRSMRVSAQQGGHFGLDETLLVMQKI